MASMDNIDPEDLLVLITSLSTSLSKNKTTAEINLLGKFFSSVGRSMLAIASEENNLHSTENVSTSSESIPENNTSSS
ncbi:hypothetical protein [Clostridium beijerinckii]|uniref:hypothetical protein n=1 Tax=Clostridium beijerinckii TaxID=1520 RepID=UPI00098CBF06|nr:hypothetical protein [Clostridium beijerinckii]NRT76330.1 hypothetical protein [Clostridium beijerinckii]OOM48633.1 hypothetical protein CBEIJ_21050 [Clostridium beijerinckii]